MWFFRNTQLYKKVLSAKIEKSKTFWRFLRFVQSMLVRSYVTFYRAVAGTRMHIKHESVLLLHPPARIQLPHINLAALVGKWVWRALHLYSVLVYVYTRVLHDSLWMARRGADITEILMRRAWDCFKVVKEIKAQKRIWTWAAVHCYRLSVGSVETNRAPTDCPMMDAP